MNRDHFNWCQKWDHMADEKPVNNKESMTMSADQVRALVRELIHALPGNPPAPPRGEGEDGSFAKDIQNFKRRLPVFVIGQQPYTQFKMEFELNVDQSGFVLPAMNDVGLEAYGNARDRRNNALRGLLYQCLSAEARALAGRRLYPMSEECRNMSIDEYSTKLQALFEPASESETAKHEFQARVQQKVENPLMYYSDKIALFERAYSVEKRDLQVLFDSTTNGLYNESLRQDMRRSCIRTEEEYEQKLSFFLNAIRKAVIAGDQNESDAVGTQTYSATCSYLLQKRDGQSTAIKSEPGLHAMQKKGKQPARYAVKCYYCQKPGHFARECSRKLAGLPKVGGNNARVVAVIEDSASEEEREYFEEEICNMRRKKRSSPRRNRSQDDSLSKKAINELITEDEENEPVETVDNTDQTPPAAAAEVNTIDADDLEQLEESYFLGL